MKPKSEWSYADHKNLETVRFGAPGEIIEPLLTQATSRLTEAPDVWIIDDLANKLAVLHDQARNEGWANEFKNICQAHPIAGIILQDPYTKRAFEKPRGYAGDAVMLDYIYKPSQIEASALGTLIHRATTQLPNAQSILWRRDYLARQIIGVMERCSSGRALSVASGHLRELDSVRASTTARNIEIWALDQDQSSIQESQRSYPDFSIRPISKSISFLFKGHLSDERFDLIYSAGLADYLPDETLKALIRILHKSLAPNGILTIGNFTPDSHGRGFMEAFMDWSLIYRDENDLIRIVEEAAPGCSYKVFRDEPSNVAYIELTS